MKRFFSRSIYFKWGVTAFVVVSALMVFYTLLTNGRIFLSAIHTIGSILSPVIWGLVISYLLWPLVKLTEAKLFNPLLKKLFPKRKISTASRALSIALAIFTALLLIGGGFRLRHHFVISLLRGIEEVIHGAFGTGHDAADDAHLRKAGYYIPGGPGNFPKAAFKLLRFAKHDAERAG